VSSVCGGVRQIMTSLKPPSDLSYLLVTLPLPIEETVSKAVSSDAITWERSLDDSR
jgi:hypothetical protein